LKLPLLFEVLGLVTGCTAVQYSGSSSAIEEVDYPPLEDVVTASVGDTVVDKGFVHEEKVLFVKEGVDTGSYDIPSQTYSQVGTGGQEELFSANGVGRAARADPVKALAVDKSSDDELCVISTYGGSRCFDADYEIRDRISRSRSSFQKTLVYNGREGDRISFDYREYRKTTSRAAVDEQVEHDLGESGQIDYRGAEIEVVEADSDSITYRLLSNFPE